MDPGGGYPPPPLWNQGERCTVAVDPGAGRPPPRWIQGEGGRRGGCGRHGRGGGELGATVTAPVAVDPRGRIIGSGASVGAG